MLLPKAIEPTRLNQNQRWLSAAIGVGLMSLLLLASWLQPNSSGMGTHRQLGLPPCTFLMLFGIRCPSCGMTTSWSYFMRGNLSQAWATNAGGACLAALAMVGGSWSLWAAIRGNLPPTLPRHFVLAIAVAVFAITVADWISRILPVAM